MGRTTTKRARAKSPSQSSSSSSDSEFSQGNASQSSHESDDAASIHNSSGEDEVDMQASSQSDQGSAPPQPKKKRAARTRKAPAAKKGKVQTASDDDETASVDNNNQDEPAPKRRRKTTSPPQSTKSKNSNPSTGSKTSGGLAQKINDAIPAHKRARVDDKGNYLPNLGNLGGIAGEEFVMERNGEYTGIAIRLLENARPILTDKRVLKAMEQIEDKQFLAAAHTLWLDQEMSAHGMNVLFGVIGRWLEMIGVSAPIEYAEHSQMKILKQLEPWMQHQFSTPVITRFEISAIGGNDFGSVVPDDWLGREFANGRECHAEMDKLPWRQGKPPVCYCITSNLLKRETKAWSTDMAEAAKICVSSGLSVVGFVKGKGVVAAKLEDVAQTEGLRWRVWDAHNRQVVVVTDLMFDEQRAAELKKEKVALLVSTMQKAIRRGRENFGLVGVLVEKLCNSKPYHLPEHQFLRVSAARQVCWRLFICCLEDVCPYSVESGSDILSLQDLLCLAVLCSSDSDLPLPNDIVSRLVKTAKALCYQDKRAWDWRKGREEDNKKRKRTTSAPAPKFTLTKFKSTKDEIANTLLLAVELMPMMKGDNDLLLAGANVLTRGGLVVVDVKPLLLPEDDPSKEESQRLTSLAGADMHCFPNMILHVQAAMPPHELSTQQASKFIWDHSSSLNVRFEKHRSLLSGKTKCEFADKLEEIQRIQQFYLSNCDVTGVEPPKDHQNLSENAIDEENAIAKDTKTTVADDDETSAKVSEETSRAVFLMLFGRPVAIAKSKAYPRMEVLCAGTCVDAPFVVRELRGANQEMRLVQDEDQIKYAVERFYDITSTPVAVTLQKPQGGYLWKHWDSTKPVTVKVRTNGEGVFEANGVSTTLFDGSVFVSVVVPAKSVGGCADRPQLKKLVAVMCTEGGWQPVVDCWRCVLQQKGLQSCYDWADVVVAKLNKPVKATSNKKKSEDEPCPAEVWRGVFGQLNRGEMEFGPVDRQGNKLQRAVSFKDEGYQWRVVLFLGVLYPGVLQTTKTWQLQVDMNHAKFPHLMGQVRRVLELALFPASKTSIASTPPCPHIITKLWDHQVQSVRRMVDGMLKYGKRGFGDASHVGAGKTLTALSTMAELFPHRGTHESFLVLVPNLQLIPTWEAEIKKHTKDFHVVVQQANGSLTGDVRANTIVLSSMGRCREHPLLKPWVLVIIDECLSVQNKEALQTEEAWRQCLLSKFGVCMLSATFFRSKFDKLFYMLQMLQTPFPCQKEFLDLILTEHMICHLLREEHARSWITNTHKFSLSAAHREEYNKLQKMRNNQNDKEVFIKLTKFITDNVDYPALFVKRLRELEPTIGRCLIFAKSKAEAQRIAELANNVGEYPDKSKQHIVVTYTSGTYGLNDLVGCDTILTRPPEPDKLPQMKGRLDRPGQKAQTLKLEMILIEHTVEEAWLLRLEMALFFFRKHIMPLAEFYANAIEHC